VRGYPFTYMHSRDSLTSLHACSGADGLVADLLTCCMKVQSTSRETSEWDPMWRPRHHERL